LLAQVALEDVRRRAAGEDAQHSLEKQVQRLTDGCIAEVDSLVAAKDKDIADHKC
jgi:ribosome recycling factor